MVWMEIFLITDGSDGSDLSFGASTRCGSRTSFVWVASDVEKQGQAQGSTTLRHVSGQKQEAGIADREA